MVADFLERRSTIEHFLIAGDRSWGGEGLVAERLDTRLPFIDSGYVDESQPEIEMPDLMGGLKKLFGGEQKEKDEE